MFHRNFVSYFYFRKNEMFSQNFYINDGKSKSKYYNSYDNGLDAIESATYSSEYAIRPRSYHDDSSNLESLRDMLVGRSYDSR